MPRLRVRRSDLDRSAAVAEASARYEREIESSELGRESRALRTRAHQLSERGSEAEAHALLRQAASLFDPENTTAAAASAWFDLAESFKRLQSGVRHENLLEARRLLERALSSTARHRDPLRHAATHDSLGQVLRHMAEGSFDPEERATFLRDAVLCLAEACRVVEETGCLGWPSAAERYHNLGNALLQRGDTSDAVKAHEKSLEYLQAVRENAKLFEGSSTFRHQPTAQLSLAKALVRRARPGDLERALSLYQCIVDGDDRQNANKARLGLVDALRARGTPEDRAAALECIRRVDSRDMEPARLEQYINALVDLGADDTALLVTRKGVMDAMERRQSALAAHVADHHAAEAQRFGVLEARIHASAGRPVEAFLALENTSGLRYQDAITGYAWVPSEPISRGLSLHRASFSEMSCVLDDLASRIAYLPATAAANVLEGAEAQLREHADSSPNDALGDLGEPVLRAARAVAEARTHGAPGALLRERARSLADRVRHLDALIHERDPSSDRSQAPWSAELQREAIHRVLSECSPGTVLLRLHLDADLLAVVVWFEAGEVTGRCQRIAVPDVLVATVGALSTSRAPGERRDRLKDLSIAIDLGGVLPERGEHLVILPSLLASLVPWAAMGPRGRTPLDRFAAISYLPNLAPLLMRQAPCPPRSKALIVAPGGHPADAPTRYHRIAFRDTHTDETRLTEADASMEKVLAAARSADVVSFYAHGDYGPEGGAIGLADGNLSPDRLGDSFSGCERVELWACRTGVNLPYDWLTPYVDEAFGLDIAFHHRGVRSTIGSLWKVPDFVTGHIVRRFRQGLRDGLLAPAALATAQRWWRDEAIPRIQEILVTVPRRDALRAIADALGCETPDVTTDLLGPVDDDVVTTPAEVERLLRDLSAPEAWAGYRFVGVCERRSNSSWTSEHERHPSDGEQEELARLLASEAEPRHNLDTIVAQRLNDARSLRSGEAPTPAQAIRVSRLYMDRREGRHRHDVLRGLAWLSECLALSNDWERQLRTEAAWSWLELARGELVEERLRPFFPPDPGLVARLGAALEGLDSPESIVLSVWRDVLGASGPHGEAIARERFQVAWTAANSLHIDTYEGCRARAAALELLLLRRELDPAMIGELIAPLAEYQRSDEDAFFAWARLRSVLSLLGQRTGRSVPPPRAEYLSHRGIARSLDWHLREAAGGEPRAHLALDDALNQHIGFLEADIWGYPADDGLPSWMSTGTPGRPWFEAMGSYLGWKLSGDLTSEPAVHFIASVNAGADLRIGPMNLWARLFGDRMTVTELGPWWSAWTRGEHLQQLEDAARLFGFPHEGGVERVPDVFRERRATLREVRDAGPTSLTGYQLATSLENWRPPGEATRTAAFELERALMREESQLLERWSVLRRLGEGSESVRELFEPQRALADAERWVHAVPDGTVLCSVAIDSKGALLAAAVWREEGVLQRRTRVGADGSGFMVVDLLARLVQPNHVELGIGESEGRDRPWSELCGIVGPVVEGVLGDACDEDPRYLAVLAPGPLRSLPWLGLPMRGRSIRDHFSAAVGLPHIGFERSVVLLGQREANPFTVCALGVDDNSATPFGPAAIRTLRDVHGVTLVAEPERTVGMTISEVDRIEEIASSIQVLRFYGSRGRFTLNPTTEGLGLSGRRTFSTLNLAATLLPRCEAVELWASTGSFGEARSIASGDRDVMPRLVRAFLVAGAAGVLDLAWPVPDMVMAMVCETHGHLRCTGEHLPGAMALRMSLALVEHRLAQWRKASPGFHSVREALCWLDDGRRFDLQEDGHDGRLVHPFASVAGRISCTPAALIEEMTRPVHLAAFRWWGA